MTQSQATPFTLAIDGIDETLRVTSLRGHEEVNELFSFEMVVATQGSSVAVEEVALNRSARLTIEGRELPRVVSGIVRSARLMAGNKAWDGDVYRITLVPQMWRLKPTRNSRIFQDLTVPQIVDIVMDAHGIDHIWATVRAPAPPKEGNVESGSFRPRTYCVQYQESDYELVRRLLGEEGLFFSFDHPAADAAGATEIVVLSDEASRYRPIAGSARVPLRDDTMTSSEEGIGSFDWGGQLLTGATLLREYDFERPALDLIGAAKSSDAADAVEAALRIYDHEGRFAGEHVTDHDAKIQLEQLRSQRRTGSGSSWCTRLMPGRTFQLEGAPTERLNRAYVVTSVIHEGTDPTFSEGGDTRRRYYENKFACLLATTPCRPARRRWQVQQTFETATVVGPKDSEIHTDPHGRIKVQFHWDLHGKRNEHSSCWMRVMQPWAGAGWGHQFIPRVGMEVLVLLLGGDIDNPFVIGSAYNGANRAPFSLETDKTRSGLRTRSSPNSDGFNELSFEDLTGSEEVYLHAQRDLREHVLRDHGTVVLNDQTNDITRHQIEIVGGNQTLSVHGNRAETVDMDLIRAVLGNEAVTVDGDRSRTIGGDHRESIEGDHKENVDGSHRRRIGKNCALEVGDNLGVRATGEFVLEVTGDAQAALSANCTQTIGGNHHAVVTGMQSINVAQSSTLNVGGTLTLAASAIVLAAPAGFRVVCGASSITMHDDEVEIKSDKITVSGKEEVTLRAAETSMFMLDGNGTLVAEEVLVQAKGSELRLDDNAKLNGGKVSLATGQGEASYSEEEEDGKPVEPPKLRVQFVHAWNKEQAYGDAKVIVKGHGPAEPWETKTDKDGWLEIPVHHMQCVIEVEMPDEELSWRLNHGSLEALEEDMGVRQRLGNLGFGQGNPRFWSDRDFLAALREFEELANPSEDYDDVTDDEEKNDFVERESPDEVDLELRRLIDEHRSEIGKRAGQ